MTHSTLTIPDPRRRASVSRMNWWLASSDTLEGTLLIVRHMGDEFNLGNISTAMHQLAALAGSSATARRWVVRQREFGDLIGVVRERLEEFEPGHLSNTLWSLAKLDHHPGEPMFQRFVAVALRKLHDFTPKNACRMLWASARFGLHPGQAALERFSERVSSNPDDLGPVVLSDALWSLATLRHHPGEAALDRISARVLATLGDIRPSNLAAILWSLAKLGHNPGAEALDRISAAALANPTALSSRPLSCMSWSLAVLSALGDAPGPSVLRALGELLHRHREKLTPVEACRVFHAHVLLDMQPGGSPLADKLELLDAARRCWMTDIADSTQHRTLSALERKVEASLERLGEQYHREQLTEDGCFSIDFGLVDPRMKIALEADGPYHHLTTVGGGRRPDGSTLVRNRCLEARGWRVVAVRDNELARMDADIDALIAGKLNAVRSPRTSIRRRLPCPLRLRGLISRLGAAIRAGWKKLPELVPDCR